MSNVELPGGDVPSAEQAGEDPLAAAGARIQLALAAIDACPELAVYNVCTRCPKGTSVELCARLDDLSVAYYERQRLTGIPRTDAGTELS